jgi:hypothetical protein
MERGWEPRRELPPALARPLSKWKDGFLRRCSGDQRQIVTHEVGASGVQRRRNKFQQEF